LRFSTSTNHKSQESPSYQKYLVPFTMIFLMAVLGISCSKKIRNESDLPKKNVAIGSFGGFTGLNEKYIYLKNGQVYKYEKIPGAEASITFVKKNSRKETKRIFKMVSKIATDIDSTARQANMNNYIERNRRFRKDIYFQWTDDIDSTHKNYQTIINILKLPN
jgi:hypothetical protein